jgi:hypothetical protein
MPDLGSTAGERTSDDVEDSRPGRDGALDVAEATGTVVARPAE